MRAHSCCDSVRHQRAPRLNMRDAANKMQWHVKQVSNTSKRKAKTTRLLKMAQ